MESVSNFTKRVLIVIPVNYLIVANIIGKQLDYPDAGDMFTIGLSAGGSEPITHYWASTRLTEEQFELINQIKETQMPDADIVEFDDETEPNKPFEVLEELNLQLISQNIY